MPLARFRAFALAGALLATLSLAAVRPSAHTAVQGDLLDRAVANWSKVKTARATFEQTITNSLTGRTLTSTGEYQQQRPGKLSVRFSDPANERIVADGSHLWLYLPSSAPGQVIRTSLKEGGSGTVDLSAQFLTAHGRDTTSCPRERWRSEVDRPTPSRSLRRRRMARHSKSPPCGSTTQTRRSASST